MADQTETPPTAVNSRRRVFLLSLGTGTVAAAAAAVKPISEVVSELPQAAPAAGTGYRETDHVRDYYRTTKI